MKKIIVFNHDISVTGSTKSLSLLIEYLSNQYEFIVYNPDSEPVINFFENKGITVRKLKIPFIKAGVLDFHFSNFEILSIKSILKNIFKYIAGTILSIVIIFKEKPAIIIANEYVYIHYLFGGFLFRKKCYSYIRSKVLKTKSGFPLKFLSYHLNLYCDRIFAISVEEKEQFNFNSKLFSKIDVVGELFLLPPNNPKINSEKNIRTIINVGGISKIKGTLLFIEAAQKLLAKYNDIEFVIYGPENSRNSNSNLEYYDLCMSKIHFNSINNRIRYEGFLDPIDKALSTAWLLVSTSTISHFSRPIIESWRFGIPVVASDIQHQKDMVVSGGLLFENNSVDDLSEKIESLILSKQQYDLLKQQSFQNYNQYYNLSIKIMNRYKIYFKNEKCELPN